MYVDKDNLLVTDDGDGGDTAQREGYFTALECFARIANVYVPINLLSVDEILSFLVVENRWRRHPDQTKWYSNFATFTRDQFVPWSCCLAKTGHATTLKTFLKTLVCRFGFFPNTELGWNEGTKDWRKGQFPDIAGPEFWANCFRELGWWWTWPLLCVLDVGHVINSCLKAGWVPEKSEGAGWIFGDPNWGCDDANHVIAMMQCHFIYRTPTSWLANHIYWKHRKVNMGCKEMGGPENYPPMGALVHYFRPAWGSNPDLAQWARPLVEHMRKYYAS